jgi:indolepyruvate ferredoxin oxidoreductase beta subunit
MAKDDVTNVLMCGVGGQGVITASDILSTTAMLAGNDVKKSEVHGMSQRGGSVNTHVRFGPVVSSPLIPVGRAHILMAFELLESLRYLDFLAPEGEIIANDLEVVPTTVSSGPFDYPEDIIGHLKGHAPVTVVDGLAVARELGNVRTANTVLLGALSTKLQILEEVWSAAIYQSVPPGTEKVNLSAFEEGRRLAAEDG